MSDSISVEVAYALPDKQRIVKLDVTPGTTALEAETLSKLAEVFDELVVGPDLKIGVWGKATTAARVSVAGEQVDIYRPLLVDPKEVRKAHAAKAKAARARSDQDASGASDADTSD